MHPNRAFHWHDRAEMAAMVRDTGFGTLFTYTADGPRVVHVPVVLDGDLLTFHVARGNLITPHLDGADALLVVNGPHGYISPDWYAAGHNEVPTWNYIAVELEGRVRQISDAELTAQLVALSSEQEERLLPKAPWTLDKVDDDFACKLQSAIVGFAMDIAHWRGTRKLSQNKPPEIRARITTQLESANNTPLAQSMTSVPRS